jgi:hypothetical protein
MSACVYYSKFSVDGVQPRKTQTDSDGVISRCYQCADERWIIVRNHVFLWPLISPTVVLLDYSVAGSSFEIGLPVRYNRVSAQVMMPFREDLYWPKFCDAVGKPEWLEAEEYSTVTDRPPASWPIHTHTHIHCGLLK